MESKENYKASLDTFEDTSYIRKNRIISGKRRIKRDKN